VDKFAFLKISLIPMVFNQVNKYLLKLFSRSVAWNLITSSFYTLNLITSSFYI